MAILALSDWKQVLVPRAELKDVEHLPEVWSSREAGHSVDEFVDAQSGHQGTMREWLRVGGAEPRRNIDKVLRMKLRFDSGGRASSRIRAHSEEHGQVPVARVCMRHLQIDNADEMSIAPDALAEVEVVVSHHVGVVVNGGAVRLEAIEDASQQLAIRGLHSRSASDVSQRVDKR